MLVLVEEVTGGRYTLVDVVEFDVCRSLGLTSAEVRAVEKALVRREGFAASLSPYQGARQGVRRLRELGDVFCVTTPLDSNLWWRSERRGWLALHFGIDVVLFAEDKSAHCADVFVDDNAGHVGAWAAAWPGRAAVHWRTSHNSREAVPAGAHSIATWSGLYSLAREVALGPGSASTESAS
jgi:hypothetical protein